MYEAFDFAAQEGTFHTIVIDGLNFLMDLYERTYITPAADTRSAWPGYQQFFANLMQDKIAKAKLNVIVTAHTLPLYNEAQMVMENRVPIKGALKNQGIEAWFSTVVSTKKVKIKDLEKYENKLLTITDDDREVGFKYVYQTRLTKDTVNECIRSPEGMWTRNETYTDNDVSLVLNRIHEYYSE